VWRVGGVWGSPLGVSVSRVLPCVAVRCRAQHGALPLGGSTPITRRLRPWRSEAVGARRAATIQNDPVTVSSSSVVDDGEGRPARIVPIVVFHGGEGCRLVAIAGPHERVGSPVLLVVIGRGWLLVVERVVELGWL